MWSDFPRHLSERPPHSIEPIHVYAHGSGPNQGLSITGGYVYRGSIKELKGRYIFADFQNPRIWSLVLKNSKADDLQSHCDDWQMKEDPILLVSSFAEDENGELFVISLMGSIFKIVDQ